MSSAPNFSDIVYFHEIAQVLNMSRAAQRLGIAQPSLSVAVKRLEEAVGVPLLVRGRTGVQLTKAGENFASRSRSLLNDWQRLASETRQQQEGIGGSYVIGCHPSVATYTLPTFLPEVCAKYPEIQISLIHTQSRRIVEQVVSHQIDFGLVVTPTAHPDLVMKRLCGDEVCFWRRKNPTPNQDYRSDSAVLLRDIEMAQADSLDDKIRKKGIRFRRTITSSNLEVLATLVYEGCGIGILPTRVARRISEYDLEPILDLPRFRDEVYLIYRPEMQRSRSSKLLISLISGNVKVPERTVESNA
jgi:DNA-binding transcriptional LysR family regulator